MPPGESRRRTADSRVGAGSETKRERQHSAYGGWISGTLALLGQIYPCTREPDLERRCARWGEEQ